jgi:very-short-patch-repair endonuclease
VIGCYIADFCCPTRKLVVEIDGSQHSDRSAYDEARTRQMELLGYRIIRFWNNDVLANTDAVLDAIVADLQAAAPSLG